MSDVERTSAGLANCYPWMRTADVAKVRYSG
jgi:hypothetical protein